MKLIVCVDDQNGVLFQNRRITRDIAVINDILNFSSKSVLWMSAYSAQLFPETCIQIAQDVFNEADADDYCFLEGQDPIPFFSQVEELVVYHWNRLYPSDYRFPLEFFKHRMQLVFERQFVGNSHERITLEVYRP